ncbi:MAG TPA: tetratricopeptide repeat protein [Gemmatimonadales bacterium]|nr:tetratricopeptide repeat protein [Gemmatimonadales bacterium]
MTTPETGASAPARQPKAESFLDWFHVNSKLVTVGGVVVLVAVAGAWYYQTAKTRKLENADKQLLLAKQSLQPGNPNVQLAESDLGRVADRYAGTPAGAEAGMLLAQLKLEKGDNQGAVTYLKGLSDKLKSGPNAAAVRGLLGDAYSQLEKPAEAAAEYEAAAGLTAMPNEKAFLMSKAGHAYMAAGKHAEARKVWEALAANQESPALAAEAKVRLGELVASPAKS